MTRKRKPAHLGKTNEERQHSVQEAIKRAVELCWGYVDADVLRMLKDEYGVQDPAARRYLRAAKQELFPEVAQNAAQMMATNLVGAQRCAMHAENAAGSANEYSGAGNLYLRVVETIARLKPDMLMTDKEAREELVALLVNSSKTFSREQRRSIIEAMRKE